MSDAPSWPDCHKAVVRRMVEGQTLAEALANRNPASLAVIRFVPCPAWQAPAKIEELFGLKLKHLKKLAAQGRIRRRKLGNTVQADTLYSVNDVMEFMESGEPYACSNGDVAQTGDAEG